MFRNCPGGRTNAAAADLLKKKLPLKGSLSVTSQKYCNADEDYHSFFPGFAMHSCWLFFTA
jgi:hypothetical protein